METFRTLDEIIPAEYEEVAPGFTIRRPLPHKKLKKADPFLLLDHMGPLELKSGKGPKVPPHPHRGFQPVTLIFEGQVEHHDSMGNRQVLGPGDVQWLTAGRGMMHAESVQRRENAATFHGVQLWVNLPREYKVIAPQYQAIQHTEIPVLEHKTYKTRILAGELEGKTGPATTYSPVHIYHIVAAEATELEVPVDPDHRVLTYILTVSADYQGNTIEDGNLISWRGKEKKVYLKLNQNTQVLFLAGKPLHEPVATYGPFVMNNFKELQQAVLDYENGEMGTIPT